MAVTTFSGPIKAGRKFKTTGTDVNDLVDVGFVTMAQTAALTQTGTAGTPTSLGIVLPANSQLVKITFYVATVWNGGSATLDIGLNSTDFDVLLDGQVLNVAGYIAGSTLGTNGLASNWVDVGSSAVEIHAFSPNTGTGVAHVTLDYIQGIDNV